MSESCGTKGGATEEGFQAPQELCFLWVRRNVLPFRELLHVQEPTVYETLRERKGK